MPKVFLLGGMHHVDPYDATAVRKAATGYLNDLKEKEYDSEVLMGLLESLVNLDDHSSKEAIWHFEKLIHEALEKVGGYDRLYAWRLQKNPEFARPLDYGGKNGKE